MQEAVDLKCCGRRDDFVCDGRGRWRGGWCAAGGCRLGGGCRFVGSARRCLAYRRRCNGGLVSSARQCVRSAKQKVARGTTQFVPLPIHTQGCVWAGLQPAGQQHQRCQHRKTGQPAHNLHAPALQLACFAKAVLHARDYKPRISWGRAKVRGAEN